MGRQRGRDRQWWLWGLVLLALLAILGLTARGVWQQLARLQRLQAVEAELRAQIQYEQDRQRQLEEELRHVSSPDYPEEWVRRYGGMVRPGEIRLIVPDGVGPTPAGP
ncbi:MAG: septum formation initiator family protein [Anaerolineae bacterium]|nr:septum formation initiator family protein [Anaerolineae bacterium]MDW8068873.1 septum formation initiator family protein [Anaerolineae bacterium]